MIAVAPSRAYVASTGSPYGPLTRAVRAVAPAARNASTVPSPPSAIGTRTHIASGTTSRTPSASAVATSAAPRLPLNLSGATTMRSGTYCLVSGMSIVTFSPAARLPE